MSYILLFLLFGSTAIIFAETSFELNRIKERLQSSANQLSITELLELPKAVSYLNSDLTKNSPHKLNLAKELTTLIPEWSPQILALDPTCPYYFSKYNQASSSEDNLNLLSYLQAIQSNQTVAYPFVNVLPQSYRSALALLSIFHCREFLDPTSTPFFHNIELIIGPGKTELPLERQSNEFSQLYCSLYGSPHFILVNQTKQPTITYDAQTLLSQDNLVDVDFLLTSLPPNTCLFVPPDWVTGVQLNNSISLVFTLNKAAADELLPCTKTGKSTFDKIESAIKDTFNMTEIGLIIYFYQYLNPPMFNKEYTSETFLNQFQEDKNVSQLIMKWTPELIELIQNKLFQQLDINHDEIFNVDDYFDIKQTDLDQLQKSILKILEEIRQTVLAQYNELNNMIKKLSQAPGKPELDDNARESLEIMINGLPDQVKEKLAENNINVKELLNKIKSKKPKQSSTNQQRVKEESILTEDDSHRTDL